MAQEQRTPEKDGNVRRGRSPSYPGLNLEEAIQRTKTLHAHEGQNVAHVMLCSDIGDTSLRVGLASLFLQHSCNMGLSKMTGVEGQESRNFKSWAGYYSGSARRRNPAVTGH